MNVKMNIPFSPPDVGEAEIEEVASALRSGWITTGPKTKKLESLIAEWVGTAKCVCLNSQTACAEMALRVLGIGEGDEVITSAYTYTASASIIDHVGAKWYVDQIRPKIVIPMHYKFGTSKIDIAPIDAFLQQFDEQQIRHVGDTLNIYDYPENETPLVYVMDMWE